MQGKCYASRTRESGMHHTLNDLGRHARTSTQIQTAPTIVISSQCPRPHGRSRQVHRWPLRYSQSEIFLQRAPAHLNTHTGPLAKNLWPGYSHDCMQSSPLSADWSRDRTDARRIVSRSIQLHPHRPMQRAQAEAVFPLNSTRRAHLLKVRLPLQIPR